jgi:hypothetical protein
LAWPQVQWVSSIGSHGRAANIEAAAMLSSGRCCAESAGAIDKKLPFPCTAEAREENLASHAAEILVRHNLLIWNAAIYCTPVVRDTVFVSWR